MRDWKHRRGGSVPPFIDPEFADALAGESREKGHRKQNYKALQLCRQVQRILTLEFAGFAADELLRDVYVADVTPAAGSSQLIVQISVPPHVSVMEVLERLDQAAPRLRAAIAVAITRKRAPELAFIPVAAGEALP